LPDAQKSVLGRNTKAEKEAIELLAKKQLIFNIIS
jgi:hypothetical protein